MNSSKNEPKEYRVRFPGCTSSLYMTPLGNNLYRMEESEVIAETRVYYHDVIEADGWFGRSRGFLRVVEKSGLRVFCFLLTEELTQSEAFQVFLRRVEAHGGYQESLFGGLLIIHLPLRSACRPKSEIRTLYEDLAQSAA